MSWLNLRLKGRSSLILDLSVGRPTDGLTKRQKLDETVEEAGLCHVSVFLYV